jgi:hypothetical protein
MSKLTDTQIVDMMIHVARDENIQDLFANAAYAEDLEPKSEDERIDLYWFVKGFKQALKACADQLEEYRTQDDPSS